MSELHEQAEDIRNRAGIREAIFDGMKPVLKKMNGFDAKYVKRSEHIALYERFTSTFQRLTEARETEKQLNDAYVEACIERDAARAALSDETRAKFDLAQKSFKDGIRAGVVGASICCCLALIVIAVLI